MDKIVKNRVVAFHHNNLAGGATSFSTLGFSPIFPNKRIKVLSISVSVRSYEAGLGVYRSDAKGDYTGVVSLVEYSINMIGKNEPTGYPCTDIGVDPGAVAETFANTSIPIFVGKRQYFENLSFSNGFYVNVTIKNYGGLALPTNEVIIFIETEEVD